MDLWAQPDHPSQAGLHPCSCRDSPELPWDLQAQQDHQDLNIDVMRPLDAE